MLVHFWKYNKYILCKKERRDELENTSKKLGFRNVAHLGFLLWGLKKRKNNKKNSVKIKLLSLVFTQVNDGAHYTSLIAQPSLSL